MATIPAQWMQEGDREYEQDYMLGTNLALQAALTLLPPPSSGATQASAAPTEEAQAPPTDFDQLLQGLNQANPGTESALPELLAAVASLAESSKLLEGIEKPVGSAETLKEKKPLPEQGPQVDPLAALQALLGMVPQMCQPKEEAPVTTGQPKPSQEQPAAIDLELETPKLEAPEKPVLNLKDFDVRRFEFKTEVEVAVVQPKLIRDATFPELMQGHLKPNLAQQGDPLAALQALVGMVQQMCQSKEEAPLTTDEPKPSQEQPGAIDLELETPKLEAAEKPVLNLKDFDVRRFEFKTEVEVAVVQPKLIRVTTFPELMQGQLKPNLTQPKPVKDSVDLEVTDSTPTAPPVFSGKHEAPLIKAPEAVQRVQVTIDPPPPPPVARQISMDIGDPEFQVRVVIRERNGDLAVQFGAATERLRDNLQTAAPMLMHELRRDNPHSVSLDFSRFGTATEGGHESHQDSRPKKQLKSEAVFADVDETAYLTNDISSAKSF